MKSHHEAWLKAHPEVSELWLAQALEQGFDIHHLDENHKNNDPENLILIYHTDHMRLHHNWETQTSSNDAFRTEGIGQWLTNDELEIRIGKKLVRGERAYNLKRQFPDKTWKEIGHEVGYIGKGIVMKTIAIAKQWAVYHEKEWPIK